jgi:ankyrin repeat protein
MSDLDNLIAAAKQSNLERVNAILGEDDSLVNQKDESGATPVHYAALNGHSQIVRLLVQRGADVNSTDNRHGATPVVSKNWMRLRTQEVRESVLLRYAACHSPLQDATLSRCVSQWIRLSSF